MMWAVRSPRIGGGRRRRRPSRAKEIAGTGERVRITQGTTERIALLAVDRYLLTGGRDADETGRAYAALQAAYRGPSEKLLNKFSTLCSAEEEGQWMAQVRLALEHALDASVWREIAERERQDKMNVEPKTIRGGT